MTIEELARALLDALQAQGAYVGELETPDGSVVIDGEICPASVVRALLPLIAAELAGVLRAKQAELRAEHAELRNAKVTTDVLFLASQLARQVGEDALAIEARARKMGEAS